MIPRITLLAHLLLLTASCTSSRNEMKNRHSEEKPTQPKTNTSNCFGVSDIDKLSFQRGHYLWSKSIGLKTMPYNLEQVILGIRAAEKGETALLSDDDYFSLIRKFEDDALRIQTERNLSVADSFLNEVSKKEKVIELIKNKLYYTKVKEGKATPPLNSKQIFASYKAKVLSNDRFVLIFEEPSPLEIDLENTIPGFAKGVEGMLAGEERIIYIHPDLAYGVAGGKVEPNQLIVIEISCGSPNN